MPDFPEIVVTADGSQTVYSPFFNATYHSSHGAVQESDHVFIQNGLAYASNIFNNNISLLEFGFGTGLNALLTALWSQTYNFNIHYNALEAYPLESSILEHLDYASLSNNTSAPTLFLDIHRASWGNRQVVLSTFSIQKIKADFNHFPLDGNYNLVYLDAFAPSVQSEFWDNPFLQKVYKAMSDEGILVTYCAKGSFKRALRSAGFAVESLPGPPGKREITRASKQKKA